MSKHKLFSMFGISLAMLCLTATLPEAHAKPNKSAEIQPTKERLVLMPLLIPEEDKPLLGTMEAALIKGLQQKYEVLSADRVQQKSDESSIKESHSVIGKDCDEIRCLQDIATTFKAKLVATVNIVKRDDDYILAINIKNVYNNFMVYSEYQPCKKCNAFQVADKLKELSSPPANPPVETSMITINDNTTDSETALWVEVQKGNTEDDYTAYLTQYAKGKYVALAKSRIKRIKSDEASASAQQEQISWDSACRTSTVVGYQNHLSIYPKGRYSALVVERIAKLEVAAAINEKEEAQIQSARTYLISGDSLSYAKALELISPLANQGNAHAQSVLGWMFLNGKGESQDYAKALEWIQKSAVQGNAKAQCYLGWMYENGKGVTQDDVKALEWYQKSAEQGNANAQGSLGNMYFKGKGVAKNEERSFEYFQKSASQGDANAQSYLGWMYENGKGVTQDDVKAFEWYQKSAEQGNAKAQGSLGNMYFKGKGVAKNEERSLEYFQKSASQGDAYAQNYLGWMYENGKGVTQDDVKAFEWYQKSAEQGNAKGQNSLGNMYFKGKGVVKNEERSFEYFQKSASQGDAYAQNYLGWMYENGKGVTQNSANALDWYRKSASQGNADAQKHLDRIAKAAQQIVPVVAQAESNTPAECLKLIAALKACDQTGGFLAMGCKGLARSQFNCPTVAQYMH